MSTVKHVLILGGGIAGMSLAISLAKAGIGAEIVEADKDWRVYGAGISITGPSLRAFKALGIIDRFMELGCASDGFRIFGTMLKLYRSERPLRFFTVIGILLALLSIILAIPIVITFIETGLVPRLPTAVLSMGLMIMALLSVSSGLVLNTVTRGRREMKMLAYLSQPALKRD